MGANENGESVVIHKCASGVAANMDWTSVLFEKTPFPQLIWIFSEKCISVSGGLNVSGTPLEINTCEPRDLSQMWFYQADGSFQWAGTDKCMDLRDGGIADGTALQIWTRDTENTNQHWVGSAA
ncbi:ricin B lectin domain-containing protein [Mycena rosella]|uniref:Ricin B lectin domain-containing protein n=1 Tax=Mycena rosella TaxID=1033263 RepID=A0AAD7BP27_MYCRO|nr:ricin B lectin domain-containing protein [Mycena rosella]KAJ7629556.1 ricin B lectin domain-containing protein [Mycena rosella]